MASSPTTTRIALLICGVIASPVREVHGDYYDVYNRFCKNTVPPTSNRQVIVDGYDAKVMKYPDEERIPEYDMIMITGSASNAYDDVEWINSLIVFVQHVALDHPKVKICGICFGHQIIARVFGGKCVFNDGQWELGPTKVKLTDIGKSVFGVDDMIVQEMHRDHVPLDTVSEAISSGELYLLGSTDISACQGLVKFNPSVTKPEEQDHIDPKDIQILTVQGHPEFTEPLVTGIIRIRTASGVMSPAVATEYFGEKGDTGDSPPSDLDGTSKRWKNVDALDVVGRTIWRMLGVEC